MSKYIDAEKLIAEIERHKQGAAIARFDNAGENADYFLGKVDLCDDLTHIITSLQQKQPENIVTTANALLEALSKTPYNNKPITDAQVIVKQLLVFLKNPSSYNPNAINEQEQPEVDLEDVIENYILENFGERWDGCVPVGCFELDLMAKHFYKLGLNTRKEGEK